jgi:hypothetical protein
MKINDISQADLDFADDQSGLGYLGQNTNPAIAAAQAAREAAWSKITRGVIQKTQENLLKLGYPIGAADGQYRNRTKLAIGFAQGKLGADWKGILGIPDSFFQIALIQPKYSAKMVATEKDKQALLATKDGLIRDMGKATVIDVPPATSVSTSATVPFYNGMGTATFMDLYAAAQKGEGYSSYMGTLTAEQVKGMKDGIEAEYNKRKGAIQKAEQSITATSGGAAGEAQPEQQKDITTGAGGGGYAAKIREWMKQPWYWPVVIGGGAVLLIGIYALVRSRRGTQSVAPVQTMGLEELEGMTKPRRKRRRKSKK